MITTKCHQCGGSGKDNKEENAAACCSCYGLGRIFLNNKHTDPVDYKTQRKKVIKLRDSKISSV